MSACPMSSFVPPDLAETQQQGLVSERIPFDAPGNREESQFLQLMEQVRTEGDVQTGRNGNTLSLFGSMMRFSLLDGQLPILTTKRVAWKTCLKELLWFLRGQTDNAVLNEQGVHIWDGNASRAFLDSRGLAHYPDGELGPVYGRQWRNFNAPCDEHGKQIGTGVDQLSAIVNALRDPEQRNSRRLVMTAWNPCQLDQMALPPCHVLCQFHVSEGQYLHCMMYQRSCDLFLGVPFNILSYSFLTHLIAHHCGLKAKSLVISMGNCHLYENAVDAAKEQCARTPFPFPRLTIVAQRDRIEEYEVHDFQVDNYVSHPPIKVDMVA